MPHSKVEPKQHMSGKRRVYPQAQYSQANAGVPIPIAPSAQVPVTQAPSVASPMGAMAPMAPMAPAAPMEYVTQSMNNVNLDPAAPLIPLNRLYTTDLLKELPPPVSDLDLPPPPIVLPTDTTLNNSEYANAPHDYFRCTLNAVPNSHALLKKSKLPFALVVRPYISLKTEDSPVPVVEDALISRCRRCRCYINPFAKFVDGGRRWRCNLCQLQNDVPSGFDYSHIDRVAKDRMGRSELNYSVVEFVAPTEYMVRAPQPLVYVFAIDVSAFAVKSGFLSVVCQSILESLDRIPNEDKRARVAFMGVDSKLHFFSIPSDEEKDKEISLMCVPDLEEPLLPCPESLLVNLESSRKNIEQLLGELPGWFSTNPETNNALGAALLTSHKLISSIGGKIVCFNAALPNVGPGKLTVRDEEAHSGKPKEAQALLSSNNSFYKSFAVECNKSQVTVDMFLTSSGGYQDVATLSNLPRFTAGQTHFYPAWTAERLEDINKVSREISNHLAMEIQLEAVMRVRAGSGIRASAFFGNFFNRSSDLCSFPTFPRDQSYVIELSHDETIAKPVVSMQCAVLHTTTSGQRRIRVMTLGLPVTKEINEVYASADQFAIANYYTQKAVEKVYSSSLEESRDYVNKALLEVLSTYKKALVAGNVGSSSPLQFCTNLKMLPLLMHSLTKHIALRPGKVPSDHRAYALNLLGSLPLPQLLKYIYPYIYSLHDMPDECGNPFEGQIMVPERLNASSLSLESYGLYLLDTHTELFLWVGGDSVAQLVEDVFGVDNLDAVPLGKRELPELDNEFSVRIRNIVNKVRESKDSIVYKNLYVVRGVGSAESAQLASRDVLSMRMWCMSYLVEDRINSNLSYREYLSQVREKISV